VVAATAAVGTARAIQTRARRTLVHVNRTVKTRETGLAVAIEPIGSISAPSIVQTRPQCAVTNLGACHAFIGRREARITLTVMRPRPGADAFGVKLITVLFAVGTDIDLCSTVLSVEASTAQARICGDPVFAMPIVSAWRRPALADVSLTVPSTIPCPTRAAVAVLAIHTRSTVQTRPRGTLVDICLAGLPTEPHAARAPERIGQIFAVAPVQAS